jgi:putative ABC transport system substrate-binding protein
VRRREALLALAAMIAAGDARAQAPRVARVALVFAPHAKDVAAWEHAFVDELRERGFAQGRNLVFEARYANGDARRVPALVDEAIALRPDVLVGFESVAKVMRAKTAAIPIVLTHSSDPVELGLAQSLSHPGGNVTGVALNHELLSAKVLEMLKELLPRLSRVGLLLDSTAPGARLIEANARKAATSLGLSVTAYFAGNREELEKALAGIGRDRPDALVFASVAPALLSHSDLIYAQVSRDRLPFALAAGALTENPFVIAFGPNIAQAYRDAARYVERILKGAKPHELSIQQPTRFTLTVNLKHAQALGIRVPQSLLLRADRVIE